MWNDKINYEIEGSDGTRITCTTLENLEKLIEKTKKDLEDKEAPLDNILLPFEFIIGSLFPDSYNQIRTKFTQEYIAGYEAGFEEGYQECSKTISNNGNWELKS